MTPAGWIFMFVSVGFVWALCFWCYSKLLKQPPHDPEK